MAFEFRLPDIGEGVVEGEVVRWHVREGEPIREDQPMVEVMTDKATVEIPSPRNGVVARIFVAEGTVCKVGQPMVSIDEGNGKPSAKVEPARAAEPRPATAPVRSQPAPDSERATAARPGKVLTTPANRKLARELGVDLATVRATGPSGRITADDIRAAKQAPASPRPLEKATAPAPQAGDERIPLRGLRKKVAEAMARSKRTAAHFTYVEECDVTELGKLRERAAVIAEEQGVKLTYLPFIVKAVISALKRFPMCNATLDEERQEIIHRRNYHIGIATATPGGLIVPVVRDADRRSLYELGREIERLAQAAREGKASREELGGSTFTITSLGALGGVMATPIINYPEVAILGVHKFAPQPRVRDGAIVIRQVGNLSVSLDHRVVDGYEGAMFLQEVVKRLGDPERMLLEMV